MNEALTATLALGFGLGLKHALDADHVVAVSTIVGRERSVWGAALLGAIWGIGHTTSLFLAAVAVVALRFTISPVVASSMELCVGVMLMFLGADLLRRVLRGELRAHSHAHEHDGTVHVHLHVHAHPAPAGHHWHHGRGVRPFCVGIVHGLAGSAALTLFVLGTISSPAAALLSVLLFGAGTIAGMLLVSTVLSLPLALAARLPELIHRIQLAAGVGSFAFGVFYTWQVAVGDGLLETLLRQ
jgi:ABC-type nickel/cobalt efflux system permease component RcnA